MMGRRTRYAVVVAAVLAVAAAGCSKSNSNNSGGGGSGGVGATEKDFSISLDASSAKAGSVTFNVKNEGPSVHEFVVFKTDLAPGSLPTGSDGTVDEEGQGVEHIDEVEDIAAGATQTLTVNLAAGHYVVICNLPGHYQQGMHAELTVSS